MNICEKSSSGITLIPIESKLMMNRQIFMEGEINHETACDFIRKVLVLEQESNQKIDVLINSPGGEIAAGLLIYDVIQSSTVPIRLFCVGRAYSMAAVLFASGMNGRYMFPNSEVMIHEPLLGQRVGGSSSSIRSISESLLEAKRKINCILAQHTGKTEQEIEQATSYDHYFTAQESKDFGICDAIIGLDDLLY